MPIRRVTKTEEQEYRTRLSRLEQLGIAIGPADDPSPEPDRLTFEQTWDEFPGIYELPLHEVEVVVPAKMTVLSSGILITDVAMMTPWEDWPLDLWDREESSNYKDVIGRLYYSPPKLLNPYLKRERPLDVRQVEGVIIAHGYVSVPPECHDETPVKVELLVRDERRNELCFDFEVRMDRSLMHKWERRQREQFEHAHWTKRTRLYEPKREQPGDRKSVSPEEAIKPPHASGEHDVTDDARTLETGDR